MKCVCGHEQADHEATGPWEQCRHCDCTTFVAEEDVE
jgi:hypothetical protein